MLFSFCFFLLHYYGVSGWGWGFWKILPYLSNVHYVVTLSIPWAYMDSTLIHIMQMHNYFIWYVYHMCIKIDHEMRRKRAKTQNIWELGIFVFLWGLPEECSSIRDIFPFLSFFTFPESCLYCWVSCTELDWLHFQNWFISS